MSPSRTKLNTLYMSSAEVKKEMKFLSNQIQELMLISSQAIADGKEKWKFHGEWFNLKKAQNVLSGLKYDYQQLKNHL